MFVPNLIWASSTFPSPSSLIQILRLFLLPFQVCVVLPSFRDYHLWISWAHFFPPPHHTFFVLIDLITQVLDYKQIPSLISNIYHSFWHVVKFNKFHSILFIKAFFLSHYAASEAQIIIFWSVMSCSHSCWGINLSQLSLLWLPWWHRR